MTRSLKKWRVLNDFFSQRELAKAIGVTNQTLHNWETGKAVPMKSHRDKFNALIAEREEEPFDCLEFFHS